jgi:DedD protein
MARAISDEEVELKKRARRRLVGAVVLAAGVAVILPMVLDSEPRPLGQNVNIQIPSPGAAPPFAPEASPAPAEGGTANPAASPRKADAPPHEPAATKPEKAADAQPAKPAAIEAPKAAEPAAKEPARAAAPAKPAAKEAPKPSPAASKDAAKEASKATGNGKFVIQIAALADAAKARQLQHKAAGAGLKAYTEVVHTAKGKVTRVRVGPYASRDAAEKARARLKRAGLDGKVVPR